MLSANTTYRPGTRALIYMMVARLKYPLILAGIMTVATILSILLHSYTSASGIAPAVFLFKKCGWFFTILLSVCLALSVVPEYLGIAFRLDQKAIRLRFVILSYREIIIPYEKIIEIDVAQSRKQKLFGLSSFFMKTDQSDTNSKKAPREAGLAHLHVSLAKELYRALSNEPENP